VKKLLVVAICIIAVLSVLLFLQWQKKIPASTEAPAKAEDTESRVTRGTNGETVICVDAATQETMGLQTTTLQPAQLAQEVKTFGRVMDPVALSALVSDLLSAQANADVSRKELLRLNLLAGQNNASARTVEAAEATAQRDAALVGMARARLTAAVGNTISDQTNLVDLIKSLVSGESALVLIDSPTGEPLPTRPPVASLVPFANDGSPVDGRLVGSPLAIDAQTQTRGLLYLVESNQSRLVAGAAVTGFLQSSGATQPGFVVPRTALLRFNGATWVYVQTDNTNFCRTEVHLERPLDAGWVADLKTKSETKVVTVGAQELLSEELKGQLSGD